MQDKTAASNLPWVEKYRPKQLEDLISHEDIISTSWFIVVYWPYE